MRPELDETAPAPADRTATLRGPRPAPSGPSLEAGQQLGHFRIERQLGAGGMGEVYLATDLALDRPVALKVLPGELARDPGRRDRMVREARAQARISHPNVGHIYFVGEEAGRLFFAMEHVPGETLAARVARGPLPIDDALAAIRAAALGLREAHRTGITHRDVKPSNLMIDGNGLVKVLDFGLAAGELEPGAGAALQSSLGGTPLYMAPEQARGEPVDLRADIYALGVTLYQLVAGAPPFTAESVAELAALHAGAPRPALPRLGRPAIHVAAIDALCARMMAPRAGDRYASYDELLRAIELASPSHTRPAGFWARAIATGIDFIAVELAAVGAVEMIHSLGGPRLEEEAVLLFPALIAYVALGVARWGQTLGKAILELEVVDLATSAPPRAGRALHRAVALFGVPAIVTWIAAALDAEPTWVIGRALLAAYVLSGAALLLYAAARVTGKRAVWDRVSGTMVRYRTTRRPSAR